MKKIYCFLGADSQVGETSLEKFGQEISLSDAEAINALEGGVQLLPKQDFSERFTEQEISIYPFPLFRAEAPEAFTLKYRAALVAVPANLDALRKAVVNE